MNGSSVDLLFFYFTLTMMRERSALYCRQIYYSEISNHHALNGKLNEICLDDLYNGIHDSYNLNIADDSSREIPMRDCQKYLLRHINSIPNVYSYRSSIIYLKYFSFNFFKSQFTVQRVKEKLMIRFFNKIHYNKKTIFFL